MAPRKKYKATVILFDVNSEETFKQEALKCYLSIVGDKYFSDTLDCSQLILMNTSETRNKMNDQDETRYRNIVEATDMIRYKPENAKHIEEAVAENGNWLEGLVVAVEELVTSSDGAAFETFQLIVFSDLSKPLDMENKHIDKAVKSIIKQLCEINAYIYFLGPDVPISSMLCTKKDVYTWTQTVEFNKENANFKIVERILEECYGVMCDLNIGLDLVKSYEPSKRGFPFTEPLKFEELEMNTACCKYLDCQSVMKPVREKESAPDKIYVYAENQSEEVDHGDTIGGIALHNKLVILPEDVSKGVKDYGRFFKLLGFTDASNIPEDYMFASNTNVITVYETKDAVIGSINYIVKACHKFNKYGVALRAYSKNSRPKLYCLIPKIDPPHFIATELPYAEDINIAYETKDCSTIAFKEELYSECDDVPTLKDNIYAYLDGLNMNTSVKLHPHLMGNCSKRRFVNNMLRKIREEEIVGSTLPLGDLKVQPDSDELYEACNEKWLTESERDSNAME